MSKGTSDFFKSKDQKRSEALKSSQVKKVVKGGHIPRVIRNNFKNKG